MFRPSPPSGSLHILQLLLIQPEIVAQFMDDSQADLFADFGLAGADRFDILLIKHNVIGSALGSFGFGCPLGILRAAEGRKSGVKTEHAILRPDQTNAR